MDKKILAAIVNEKGGNFSLEDVNLAAPEKHEVLVKVVACGICGTDENERRGHRSPHPIVLGHEGSGVVVAVGPEAEGFEVGDHVIMSYASDGWCNNCKNDKPYFCSDFMKINFMGVNKYNKTPLTRASNGEKLAYFFGQSAFATYSIAEDRNLVKVDKDIDLSIVGPLGCGIMTGAGSIINGIKPKPGSSIAIFGAGPVGLAATMAAKICGCETIIQFDVVQSRLELALELGATHVFNTRETADPVAAVMEVTGGEGVDHAFDQTSREDCLKYALASMHYGGDGGQIGPTPAVSFDNWWQYFYGKTWHGFVEGEGVPQEFIPQLLQYYKEGKFPFDKLITKYDFNDINGAFEAFRKGESVKCVLVMPE